MDKNDFDVDFDFEEEYGFDPKDFLSEDEDFNFDDILDEDASGDDQDATREYHFDQPPEEFQDVDLSEDDDPDEDLAADFPEHADVPEETVYADDDDMRFYGEDGQEYPAEEDYPPEEGDYPEEAEEEPAPAKKKKKGGLRLPKLGGKEKKEKPAKRRSAEPAKKSAFSKLLDMYMEPVTKLKNEEVLDPLDPKYIRRRKREKKRIFKEVYLPAIIAGAALFLILSFIVGSVSNALTVKKNKDSAAQVEAQQQANAAGAAEQEFKRLIAEAESMVVGYDYEGAITLLDSYNGDNDKFRQQVIAKKAELVNEQKQLVEVKDVSSIPNLSFHVLMADASRACNKDVSGDLAGSYNKNFVSVEEFTRILNQLYASNYVLVDFDSFISSVPGVDGNSSYFTKSIYLPQGKKPVMITETMVNYFEYMVDPDKDGTPDAKGHGFAYKLVLDDNGEIKAAYVDSNGQTLIGNYDLVPVLEAFIQEHPDFCYQGARAILAVTGTEGVFGYRTNTSYVSRFGQAFYDDEVAGAKEIVAALREKGYTIASYTYSNQAYRSMNTLQIQAEVQNWTNQITPVIGEVDTIVFARASDIEAYSGTTFNVLYNSGIRFFLNNGSSPRVDVNTTFVRQTRLMVTGESMAWYASQFSNYFDCNVVLDLASRGSTPTKS
ncbi:MAG: hypothetical protein ACI3XG_06420 [Faecousia sp.]